MSLATSTTIATLTLPAGNYVVMGNTTMYNGTDTPTNNIVCALDDSAAGEIDVNYAATDSSTIAQTSMHLVGPLTTAGSTVTIDCSSDDDANTSAFDTHLVAIKLGSVSGTLRHFSGKALSPQLAK